MAAPKRRTPTQARAARTRAALVEAARAEFAERGYAGATARSIALRAGAASGSFYQYFNDKDELLLEVFAQRTERLRALATERFARLGALPLDSGQARALLADVVDLVIDLHRDDPKLHAVLTEREHADPRIQARAQEASAAMVELVASLLSRVGFAGDVRARAFLMVHLVEGAVHAHVLGTPMVSARRFKSDLVDALTLLAQSAPAR